MTTTAPNSSQQLQVKMSEAEDTISTKYTLYIKGNIQNEDEAVDADDKVLNAPWTKLIHRIMSYNPIDAVFVSMWDDTYKNHFKMSINWNSSQVDMTELESELWNLSNSLYEMLEIPKCVHLEFVSIFAEAF